ncbi:MAG: PQQ-binding-like beta-propeller repeat protein [Rectinemataceae bacterium]|jgi:outer membrane protein assembly factor BamB
MRNGSCRRASVIACVIFISAVFFGSCGNKGGPNPAVGKAKEAAPILREATVTLVSGEVSTKNQDTWSPLDIGDKLPIAASIKTGKKSSCDLAFGNLGTARIGADSIVEIKTISIAASQRAVELSITAGNIASKVDKLLTKDRFLVRTTDVVCGVRGTEFLVRANKSRPTVVAVQTGTVTLLPPSYDAVKLDAIAATPDGAAATDAVMASITASAPVVSASEETTVSTADMSAANAAMTTVMETLSTDYAPVAASPAPEGAPSTPSPGPLAVQAPTGGQEAAPAQPPASAPAAKPIAISASLTAALQRFTAKVPTSMKKPVAISHASKEALKDLPAPPATNEVTPSPTTQTPAVPISAKVEEKAPPPPVVAVKPITPPPAPAEIVPPPQESKPVPVVEVKKEPSYEKIAERGFVASIATSGENAFYVDSASKIYARGSSGKAMWASATDNGINANSVPVIEGAMVYYSGDRSLSAFDALTGKKRFSLALDAAESGFFGKRPLVKGGRLFLTSDTGLEIFDSATGAKLGRVPLPDGSEMTPASYGSLVCVVTRSGAFCVVDTEKRQILSRVATEAVQPVASAPVVVGDTAFFADRKGLAISVDLGSGAVKWSRPLERDGKIGVYNDPLVSGDGIYFYANGSVYALSRGTGEYLFEPLRDVAAPPFIANGRLWLATKNGDILGIIPSSGKTVKKLKCAKEVVGKPALIAGSLVFPLVDGTVQVVGSADYSE